MKEYILGVDDAGRGPVIGPMVIAGALFDKESDAVLKKHGVKDSKMLFPAQREKIAEDIKRLAIRIEAVKIMPEEIDKAVLSGFNLNKLEANKMAHVINRLTEGLEKDAKITVYVDCPSNNIPAWKNVLVGYVQRKEMNFKVEHKCDVNHVECSAASIIAKVTRDDEIKKLKKQLDEDFGSGYPSDPKTVEWLKENAKEYSEKGIIRKSWSTYKNLKEKQKKLF